MHDLILSYDCWITKYVVVATKLYPWSLCSSAPSLAYALKELCRCNHQRHILLIITVNPSCQMLDAWCYGAHAKHRFSSIFNTTSWLPSLFNMVILESSPCAWCCDSKVAPPYRPLILFDPTIKLTPSLFPTSALSPDSKQQLWWIDEFWVSGQTCWSYIVQLV